jgi:hypothetical protein
MANTANNKVYIVYMEFGKTAAAAQQGQHTKALHQVHIP